MKKCICTCFLSGSRDAHRADQSLRESRRCVRSSPNLNCTGDASVKVASVLLSLCAQTRCTDCLMTLHDASSLSLVLSHKSCKSSTQGSFHTTFEFPTTTMGHVREARRHEELLRNSHVQQGTHCRIDTTRERHNHRTGDQVRGVVNFFSTTMRTQIITSKRTIYRGSFANTGCCANWCGCVK